MDFKSIHGEALNLPLDDRAKLEEKLLLSFDLSTEEKAKDLWLVEAQRRAGEIDSGDIQPIPAEDVLRKARALLR